MVLEKKVLKFVNVFSLFRNYLLLKKGMALYLNKLESTSPKVEIGSSVLLILKEVLWPIFTGKALCKSLCGPSFEQT